MIRVRYLLMSEPGNVFTVDMAAADTISLLKSNLVELHFADALDEVSLFVHFAKVLGVWLNPNGANQALPAATYRTIAECIESTEDALDVHFVVKRRENPDDLIETASLVICHHIESSIQHGVAIPLSKVKWSVVVDVYDVHLSSAINLQPRVDIISLDKVEAFHSRVVRPVWNHVNVDWTMQARTQMIENVLSRAALLFGNVQVLRRYPVQGNQIATWGEMDFVLRLGDYTSIAVGVKAALIFQSRAKVILGLEVLAEMEKQHAIWGIATTFNEWVFIRRAGRTVEYQTIRFEYGIDDQLFRVEQLQAIISFIYSTISTTEHPLFRPVELNQGAPPIDGAPPIEENDEALPA